MLSPGSADWRLLLGGDPAPLIDATQLIAICRERARDGERESTLTLKAEQKEISLACARGLWWVGDFGRRGERIAISPI